MTTSRMLTAFGVADIAVGIAVWAVTGNAVVGVVIILVGIGLLAVPAVRGPRPRDSEAAAGNARADQQRLENETAAEVENAEERPQATGA